MCVARSWGLIWQLKLLMDALMLHAWSCPQGLLQTQNCSRVTIYVLAHQIVQTEGHMSPMQVLKQYNAAKTI